MVVEVVQEVFRALVGDLGQSVVLSLAFLITRVIGLMGEVLNLKMWFLFVVSLNSFKFLLKADCGILSIIGNPWVLQISF